MSESVCEMGDKLIISTWVMSECVDEQVIVAHSQSEIRMWLIEFSIQL